MSEISISLPTRELPGIVKRKRASRPKVKTGCVVCKIRRVKCDETKPSCIKCTSTGRKCEGYEQIDKPEATAKHRQSQSQAIVPVSATPGTNKIPITRQPSLQLLPSDDTARMSFDFFRLNTVAAIDRGSGYRLWTSIVLQLSNSVPAVRLAASALGILSRRMQLVDTYRPREAIALVQEEARSLQAKAELEYARALRGLREHLAQSNSLSDDAAAETGLVSCWLLYAFEFLRGNSQSAIVHQVSGMAVLQRHLKLTDERGSGSRISSLRSQIGKIFDAWDQRTTVWLGLDRSLMDTIAESEDPTTIASKALRNRQWILSSRGIHNLQDASLSQRQIVIAVMVLRHRLSRWLTRESDESMVDIALEKLQLLEELQAWQAAFGTLCAEKWSSFSAHERQWATLMDINARASHIRVHVLCQPSERVVYLPRLAQLQEILDLAESLLVPDNVMKVHGEEFAAIEDDQAAAYFNLGLIQPLYHVAVKSPDPDLRKKALDLLEADPWEEGGFNSKQVAKIAREHVATIDKTKLSALGRDVLEPGYYHQGHIVPMTV